MSPQKPVFQSIAEDTKIENLVSEWSVIIFQRFSFAVEDVQFLRYSCTKWNNFKSFRKFRLGFNAACDERLEEKEVSRFLKITKTY